MIEGIKCHRDGDFLVVVIEKFSDQLRQLIRENLQSVCHGPKVDELKDEPMYQYSTTLRGFLDRYQTTSSNLQVGMIGEFLVHILVPILFEQFQVVTAFFNLEEKQIKKGYDVLLFRDDDQSLWITETKSGHLRKNQTQDQTICASLSAAKSDLDGRLAKNEPMYWYNAINSVTCALNDGHTAKETIKSLLMDAGNLAVQDQNETSNHSILLAANLFDDISTTISTSVASDFYGRTNLASTYERVCMFCLQKSTHQDTVDFLEIEAANL